MAGLTFDTIKTDVLIIGAGGAGARAAIEAAQAGSEVTLVCRSPIGKGGLTPTANGGYHAAVVPGDSPAIHAEDLITMGRNLNDPPLVHALTEDALAQVRILEKYGARINWDIPPKPHEPQMCYPRSLFVPGKVVMDALRRELKKYGNIRVLEDHLAMGILKSGDEAAGAVLFDIKKGKVVVCRSSTTVLATGSLGEIYPLTAQEPMGISTGSVGSGYVLAHQAGADLVDMEMVQFAVVPVEPPIIREIRCLPWAPLLNAEGREFLSLQAGEYSHEAALSVCRELKRGPVTMDLRGKQPAINVRHLLVARRNKLFQKWGVTPYQRPVSIGLGALYMMGGVHINERCETSVSRLYAAGEVAGGVHGARRAGGNAFPEMLVFGARAGKYAAVAAKKKESLPELPAEEVDTCLADLSGIIGKKKGDVAACEVRLRSRAIMGRHAHMMRNGSGLQEAVEELKTLEKDLPFMKTGSGQNLRYNFSLLDILDAGWLVRVSRIVCQAALLREESRGFHFREDFPEEDPSWLRHTLI